MVTWHFIVTNDTVDCLGCKRVCQNTQKLTKP